jgi:hypothetical protein
MVLVRYTALLLLAGHISRVFATEIMKKLAHNSLACDIALKLAAVVLIL